MTQTNGKQRSCGFAGPSSNSCSRCPSTRGSVCDAPPSRICGATRRRSASQACDLRRTAVALSSASRRSVTPAAVTDLRRVTVTLSPASGRSRGGGRVLKGGRGGGGGEKGGAGQGQGVDVKREGGRGRGERKWREGRSGEG